MKEASYGSAFTALRMQMEPARLSVRAEAIAG